MNSVLLELLKWLSFTFAAVCLVLVSCGQPAHAIAAQTEQGYADPAHKSSGPDFGESGKLKAHSPQWAFFVRDFRLCPRYGKAGWDTREGVPVTFSAGSPTRPVLPPYLAKGGRTLFKTEGA